MTLALPGVHRQTELRPSVGLSERRALCAGVSVMPLHQGAQTERKEPIPEAVPGQSRDPQAPSGRGTWLRVVSRGALLAHVSSSQRPFFLCEICSTALPTRLSLFIGTGPGRLRRNYLTLGHA